MCDPFGGIADVPPALFERTTPPSPKRLLSLRESQNRRFQALTRRNRPAHVLVASTGPAELELSQELCSRLRDTWSTCIEVRVRTGNNGSSSSRQTDEHTHTIHRTEAFHAAPHEVFDEPLGFNGNRVIINLDRASEWADVLVLFATDADVIAKMLAGMTDNNAVLTILRGWDVAKPIFMVPGMTTHMWEHPLTRRHLDKIRRRFGGWVQLFEPFTWHAGLTPDAKLWKGWEDLLAAVGAEIDAVRKGPIVDRIPAERYRHVRRNRVRLPVEVWCLILEELGDWEIAEALGIPTQLPRPIDWAKDFGGVGQVKELEEIILRGTCQDVARFLQKGPVPKSLSAICIKLIMKFEATDILSYLEKSHKELFWKAFSGSTLTTKASAVYGKTAILEWWLTSPSFSSNRAYDNEAMDGASHAGFLHVLDWWRRSGLRLSYTEAALEQASAKGKLDVLEWWRNASVHGTPTSTSTSTSTLPPLRLKVGKSICLAAQHGEAETVRWWDRSGIAYAHEEAVARLASAYGQVRVLEVWKEVKGEKMIFDNQVLVGPTRNGHRDVLEWWKNSGIRVEYRPCDIEEALEDASYRVRRPVENWWIENGVILGVGTSEWMQVKVLWGNVADLTFPSVGAFPL
ncbi:MAG: hypothetical protein M1816_007501 [Peltula sp. TS41687]|nr:MAG: hypothetical protein M1816_007501 [Peltula sp. TS41687]